MHSQPRSQTRGLPSILSPVAFSGPGALLANVGFLEFVALLSRVAVLPAFVPVGFVALLPAVALWGATVLFLWVVLLNRVALPKVDYFLPHATSSLSLPNRVLFSFRGQFEHGLP